MSLINCFKKLNLSDDEQKLIEGYIKPFEEGNDRAMAEALGLREYAKALLGDINALREAIGRDAQPIPGDFTPAGDVTDSGLKITIPDALIEEVARLGMLEEDERKEEDLLKINAFRQYIPQAEKFAAQRIKAFAEEYGQEMFESFQQTLEMGIVRIPATGKKTLMPAKIVGFVPDAGNTFYTNTDLLYLQGADQDIDKGNLLSYEPNENGIVEFSDDVENETNLVKLRNNIVREMINAGKDKNLFDAFNRPTTNDILKDLADRPNPEFESMNDANPISTLRAFVLGQAGKSNVGIHANGLKAYSAIFHSYNLNDFSFSSGFEPKYFKTHEFDAVDALEFYDQLIQASVDNAKDPILGRIGINDANGNLVNTLALFSQSPKEIVEFLALPEVKSIFEAQLKSRRVGEFPKDIISLAEAAFTSNPKDSLNDLVFYLKAAEELEAIGKFFGVNKEVPNSVFDSYSHQRKLNRVLNNRIRAVEPDFTSDIYDWVKHKIETGEDKNNMIELYDSIIDSGFASFNIYQILNDNPHFLNYVYLSAKVNEVVDQNSPVKVMTDTMANLMEDDKNVPDIVYNDMLNYNYGLVVDKYLSSIGSASIITLDGKDYDLSDTLERKLFISQFPRILTTKIKPSTSKKTFLNAIATEVTQLSDESSLTLLKPYKRYSAMSVEDKIEISALAKTMDEQTIKANDKDSKLSELMFYYWLIRDKGMNKPMSFTFMMDPTDQLFETFNDFIDGIDSMESLLDVNEVTPEVLDGLMANYLSAAFVKRIVPNNMIQAWKNVDPISRYSIPHKHKIDWTDVAADLQNESLFDMVSFPRTTKSLRNKLQNEKGADGRPLVKEVLLSKKDPGVVIQKMLDDYGFEYAGEIEKNGEKAFKFTATGTPKIIVSPFRSFETTYTHSNLKLRKQIAPSTLEGFQSKRVGKKVLQGVVDLLNQNTGGDITLMSASRINTEFGSNFASLSGFTISTSSRDVRIINEDFATLDTPMHETGHLWIEALADSDNELYKRVLDMVNEHPVMNEVRRRYPELNPVQQAEEGFAQLFGVLNQEGSLRSSVNQNFFGRFADTIRELKRWFTDLFKKLFNGGRYDNEESLADLITKTGNEMLESPFFRMTPVDLKILSKFGIRAAKLNEELQVIKDRLTKSGLIERICN